jgi:hypothetical protein
VSILDDHDHVIGSKVRFSAGIPDDSPVKDYQVAAATAFQLFTLGIPCIYSGSEQAFAGPAHRQLPFVLAEGWDDGRNHGDRFLREAMFGPGHPRAHHDRDIESQVSDTDPLLPGFGPFGTAGAHCFDRSSPAYVRIAALCSTRAAFPVLRLGRQYQRQTRLPETGFLFPRAGELAAWSRILDTEEAVIVVNPNGASARGGDVVVSGELFLPGAEFVVVVNTAEAAARRRLSGDASCRLACTGARTQQPGRTRLCPDTGYRTGRNGGAPQCGLRRTRLPDQNRLCRAPPGQNTARASHHVGSDEPAS